MGYVLPLKGPVDNLEPHNARRGLFSCIPVIGGWFKFASRRKQDRRIVSSLRAQLRARSLSDVDRSWIKDDDLRGAAQALFDSLRKRLGWETDKITANDPMGLLLLNEDDLHTVEVQMDLQDWLDKKVDPRFFNDEFAKLTFQEATEWLAKSKAARG